MRWPQLWTRDLDGALKWIQEVLANSQQEEATPSEASPAGSAAASGSAQLWFGSAVPDDWLALDGSLVFITEAPELFQVLGYNFDPAPPAGMFRLPPAPPAPAGTWIIRR